MIDFLKRILVGSPLKTAQSSEERLSKKAALAIFSSDALSSTAYATEEILLVLTVAGATFASLPIATAIVILLIVIIISYGQTLVAYPSGGGAYIVAKENLGRTASLVAGASLLIDYILTVAVSVSAGVAAITSALPRLYDDRIIIAALAIGIITLGNLRGIKESGRTFAVPAYFFIGSIAVLVVAGLVKYFSGVLPPSPDAGTAARTAELLTPFILLRAFASGCAALTGVEAISNGVQAFRKPEAKNARITLYTMGAILAFLFLGITLLSQLLHIVPAEGETVVSQIARGVFGRSLPYYLVQTATALILLLAANTSYAGFPRLASILARDKFLPVQLAVVGDRLVYSNGILILSLASLLLISFSGGDTHRLVPLYAIGVFTGFALSQFGMVKKWLKERNENWRAHAALNGFGGVVTTVVLAILAVTKFSHGAWMVLAIVPAIVGMMVLIKRHYSHLRTALTLEQEKELPVPEEHVAIIFVGDIHKGTVAAARYTKALKPTKIKAIHVSLDERDSQEIREKWDRWGMDIPLIITPSPYREIIDILVHYVREIEHQNPKAAITIILPEFICPHWWQLLLHNQMAARIRNELLFERVAVVSVPIQLQ